MHDSHEFTNNSTPLQQPEWTEETFLALLAEKKAELAAQRKILRDDKLDPRERPVERAADITITLRAVPPIDHLGRDGAYRLKLALKTLLRAYGLQCVSATRGA